MRRGHAAETLQIRTSLATRRAWRPPSNAVERKILRQSFASLGADEAGAEDEDVGVVVLARETRASSRRGRARRARRDGGSRRSTCRCRCRTEARRAAPSPRRWRARARRRDRDNRPPRDRRCRDRAPQSPASSSSATRAVLRSKPAWSAATATHSGMATQGDRNDAAFLPDFGAHRQPATIHRVRAPRRLAQA